MTETHHSEFLQLHSVCIKPVENAFVSNEILSKQWVDLNYLSKPDYNKALIEYQGCESRLQKESVEIYSFPKDISVKIHIEGHTDNVGKKTDNQILSENRAKAVYNYLYENRINSNRLTFKGYGESKEIASNSTEKGREKNRRTSFVIKR